MAHVEVPPPVGSSGQHVDALIINAATSELRQVYAIGSAVSSAVFAPVTSSAGLLVNVSSGTFTLSSAPTVSSTATTITSGTVTVSNPTTAVNVANSPTVLTASSGYLVRSLSSGTVTLSSAAALSSGVVTLSSVHTFTLSSATSLSSGTVTLSSAPLVIVASSGGTIPVTLSTVFSLSSVPTVTATAATNPWSSAPGFNMPVVSVSSGLIQLTSAPLVVVATSGGTVAFNLGVTTAAGLGTVTSSWGMIVRTAFSQSSGRLIVGTSVGKISSAPGVLHMIAAYTTGSSGGLTAYLRLYDQTTGNATSSSNSGLAGACFMTRLESSISNVSRDALEVFPHGLFFATACSYDVVLTATSTAANAIGAWVSAHYTS